MAEPGDTSPYGWPTGTSLPQAQQSSHFGSPAQPPPGYPPRALSGGHGSPQQGYPSHGALDTAGNPADGRGPFLDRPGAPPATKRAAGFWLIMAFVGFAIGQVVATIFVFVAAAATGHTGDIDRYATMAEPPEWYITTSLVGLWIGFFLGPFVASKARGTGRFIKDLGIRFRPIDLLGIPIGVGGQILVGILYAPFISHFHWKNLTGPTTKITGSAHGGGIALIAVLTVVGAPFFEEILFRGAAMKALARLFTPNRPGPSGLRTVGLTAAFLVDGVLFGLAHWELYQFAGLALFGMVLALISYRTGRLGMNMVSHASFNLVAVIAIVSQRGVIIH